MKTLSDSVHPGEERGEFLSGRAQFRSGEIFGLVKAVLMPQNLRFRKSAVTETLGCKFRGAEQKIASGKLRFFASEHGLTCLVISMACLDANALGGLERVEGGAGPDMNDVNLSGKFLQTASDNLVV